ncbi:neuronal acetylcholine receptor subunit alpha-10-like isoform X2 [Ostrea edulis]|nr:neuronal acetylcholine receptor subunit alpha-10-like isoform X2 [Ostrea edulis]XP_048733397.1 neuronal acetylcholine receptor subunit alpha-10-like isoform X2 [Ostrea edulis]XP_056022471.1 neuronal acetylcholine receptor subunit alpha-10-like isoform X2 [Ostrea edulis]
MTSRCILLCCVVYTALLGADADVICMNSSRSQLTDEQRLYKKLMYNYDRNTRPVYNASHPVNVNISISLTQIFDVDEKNQFLTTNIWLDQSWMDEKLIWNPEDYNNLTVLRIPCTNIWLPDIVLYNSAEDYTEGYMEALAMVSYDGQVFWPPIVKFRSTCEVDITYYPFDDQLCKMKFGSWAYDGSQVDVFNTTKGVDLTNFVRNGEWELLGVKSIRHNIRYPCCSEMFPDVTFWIHLKRRTLYYAYNVIIPCVMLSVLTMLGFWIRPESGEKVSLGLTVLLAFSVFMLLIAENMPATSNFVPLIGIYLTTVMSLTSFSVIMAVVTSNINVRGFKEVDLPKWFRKFIIFCAKVNGMKLAYVTHTECGANDGRERLKEKYYQMHTTFSNDSGCALIDYENNSTKQRCEMRGPSTEHVREVDLGSDSWVTREILARLQMLVDKEEEKDRSDLLCKRWMEAAEVIDRCLFWLFISGTLLSTIILLVVIPTVRPYNNHGQSTPI